MKLLLIAPNVMPIPPSGYSGLEQIVYELACGMRTRGHQVAVVAPKGSRFPDGIEVIETELREPEQRSFERFQARLPEFEVIHDHTWEGWVYVASAAQDRQLPVIHTLHSAAMLYGKPPPVRYPCFVGLSRRHAALSSIYLGIEVRSVYNGADPAFYQRKEVPRVDRLLVLGRYTPEKGMLEAIQLCKRMRVPVDCYGDVGIVADPAYAERCKRECDGEFAHFHEGVSRDETVELYSSHQALLNPINWEEPFGLVAIEAQMCGMPVLTYNRGAMPELVRDGVSGVVATSERQLAEAIETRIWERLDPLVIRANGLNFSVESMVDGYEALYKDLLAGNPW